MVLLDQTSGLALVLDWGDGDGAHIRDKLFFATLATSVAGPMAAISYRVKGMPALARATSFAAAPLVAYALQPSYFTASAMPPVAVADGTSEADAVAKAEVPTRKVLPDLHSIVSLYHPWNLFKMLAKNLFLQFMREFNKYMTEYMDHERAAIMAEAQGDPAPPAPPMPDMMPAWDRSLSTFARELSVATVRRVYEHIAAWRLPGNRAQALLRDSKAWIRDVLSVKYRSAPLSRRFVAYQFATLHSAALFCAADCTVSVVQHTYRTWRDKRRLEYWARGVVLQVGRCSVMLMAVSVGAALGSLVRPGIGTQVGQALTEVTMSLVTGYYIEMLLE